MTICPTEFSGLLFIGDPHVSSKRVGRRKDAYLDSVLEKLRACSALCHERNLYPVVLGDLFHRNDDNNLSMLNDLVEVLQSFPVPPVVLEGNHDKEQSKLTKKDALMLLARTAVVRVACATEVFETIRIAGRAVNLFMVPYGHDIPREAPELEGLTIMVTHHDLAFGGAYPGALPLTEVRGVMMAVNGHMHGTKPSVTVGQTVWHNPGNIEPLSVDLADHVPCAWEWTPEFGAHKLMPHALPHGADLFDMTGLQVEAGDSLQAVEQVVQASEFARELESQSTLDAQRTDDASVLLEDLEFALEASSASDATKLLLRNLAKSLAS